MYITNDIQEHYQFLMYRKYSNHYIRFLLVQFDSITLIPFLPAIHIHSLHTKKNVYIPPFRPRSLQGGNSLFDSAGNFLNKSAK